MPQLRNEWTESGIHKKLEKMKAILDSIDVPVTLELIEQLRLPVISGGNTYVLLALITIQNYTEYSTYCQLFNQLETRYINRLRKDGGEQSVLIYKIYHKICVQNLPLDLAPS